MYHHNFQTCLGIPTPKSLQELVGAPPACLSTCGDQEAIQIIENDGKVSGRPGDEITQAKNLASGFSDMVIILERPLDRRVHKFSVSFDEFVKSSKTLSAVDELIRFASNGARSIHTVTVLNAFSYQPNKLATQRDKDCHELLARVLRAKKPKVILRCHREEYLDEWLKRIELPGKDYQLERKEISITEEHSTVVVQSFHPSCAINNADCRPEYRALLMYHFMAAFSELRFKFSPPETAEEIRKLCLMKGERVRNDIPDYKPWEAAINISRVLEKAYRGPCKVLSIGFADETPCERRGTQITALNTMHELLKQLFGSSTTFGCLGIAKIVLFLWKQHFQDDPLYEHIMSWLLLRGNEQKDWFPCESHLASDQRTLEERLSDLRISEPIRTINLGAILLAARVSVTLIRGECLGESLRAQTIDAFEKHNALVRRYLSGTSMSDINDAMQIRALLIRCEVFLSAINDRDYTLERGDTHGLVVCLKQLGNLVDCKDVL